MRTALVMAVTLAVAVPARAEDWHWTREDVALEAAFVALVAVDWQQTRRWGTQKGFAEMNPLLGESPNRARIDGVCAAAALGHIAVSASLPRSWRRLWFLESFIIEGAVVTRNAVLIGGRF